MVKAEEYIEGFCATMNCIDKNYERMKSEKASQELERHDYIVNYFVENPDRVNANKYYLGVDNLMGLLRKKCDSFMNMTTSDKDFNEKLGIFKKTVNLRHTLNELFNNNLPNLLEKIKYSRIKEGKQA
jgi:hypothetical protein